ncbi:MAG: cell division protein FtsA [Bacteroidales bacterium]|nr:cell division protein FtsA [Bacteroidales bacterium]
MGKYLAAIDLETTKVVTIIGEDSSSGVRIVAYNEAPLKKRGIIRGDVVNIQKVYETLLPTIRGAEEEIDEPIDEVIMGLSGSFIRSETVTSIFKRNNPDTPITKKEIEKITEEQYKTKVGDGEQIIDVVPQNYNIGDVIGVDVNDIEGMSGKEIESTFKIFVGKSISIKKRKEVIEKCKINISQTVLSPIASARAVLTEQEMENGVALIDIGGGKTDIIIIKDNIIVDIAVIPFGGNSITEDIRYGTCVSSKAAEQMKIRYGCCIEEGVPENKKIVIPGVGGSADSEVSLRLLAQIVEARMSEIFDAVAYKIEQSGYLKKIPAGIVITGGSCYMENIIELAKALLNCNVRLAAPQRTIADGSHESSFNANSSSAVGLILIGFDRIKADKNMLGDPGRFSFKQSNELKSESLRSDSLFSSETIEEITEIKKEGKSSPQIKKSKEKKRSLGNIFEDIFSDMKNNKA